MNKSTLLVVPPKRPLERRTPVLTLLNPWSASYEIYMLNVEGLQLIRVLSGVNRIATRPLSF